MPVFRRGIFLVHRMPAPMIQDLFYGPSLIKGREMFNHVLYREHCLGESRLQQLLSGQKMVYIQPPFMSPSRVTHLIQSTPRTSGWSLIQGHFWRATPTPSALSLRQGSGRVWTKKLLSGCAFGAPWPLQTWTSWQSGCATGPSTGVFT